MVDTIDGRCEDASDRLLYCDCLRVVGVIVHDYVLLYTSISPHSRGIVRSKCRICDLLKSCIIIIACELARTVALCVEPTSVIIVDAEDDPHVDLNKLVCLSKHNSKIEIGYIYIVMTV